MGKDDKKPNEPAAKGGEEESSPGCCGCGCCACCCTDDTEHPIPANLQDPERFFSDRSCTDCCMVLLYAIFVVGWIIIISLAAAYGKPDRILFPENFRGQLCGDGDLKTMPNYFVPLPSRSTYGICVPKCPGVGDVVCNNDLENKVENATIKVRNDFYDQTRSQLTAGLSAYGTCKVSTCDATTQASADRYIATQLKLKEKKCFIAFYPSGASLYRCIPGKGQGETNVTLQSLANESAQSLSSLADALGVGSFFQLGFAEIEQTWRVILISAFTGMGIALVWVLLLRWILAPVVYFVIFLILAVLVGLGFIFRYFADDLEAGALPGESGVENQAKLWRAAQWITFLIACIYFGVMLHMLQRIRIAIAIMKEASKAFTAAPSMLVIPLVTFTLLIGWVAFFIATTIYIQTMGSEAAEAFAQSANDLLGENLNISALIAGNNNSAISAQAGLARSLPVINMSQWSTLPQTKVLHLYNFFGVLWTGNICLMFGFMTMAMTVTSWYFSATQIQIQNAADGKGEEEQKMQEEKDAAEKKGCCGFCAGDEKKEQQQPAKEGEAAEKKGCCGCCTGSSDEAPKKDDDVPPSQQVARVKQTVAFATARAAWVVFRKHFGTVAWGAFLIAIVQFVRAIFTYISENYLKEAKDNVTMKILLRCIQCCLWYIEQIIKLISKNAYIVTCIRNTSFCVSAFSALKLLLSNAARLVILSMLSAATLFLIKVFVVGINFFIAFGLIRSESLTDDRPIQSGLFPLFLITIMSFVIASLFMNVYESCIDTIFLCFLIDEEDYKGMFLPKSLEEIVQVFADADKARQEYEKHVKDAMTKAEKAEAGRK